MLDNIQRSEKTIAVILGLLIERGIQTWRMVSEDVDIDNELRPFFVPCFKWLVSEGIVGAENILETTSGMVAVNPSLTSLGFVLLGENLNMEDGQIKLANAVEEVRTTQRSFSQAGDFCGGILAGFVKSLAS
ncbi:MAG: hypothetical protein WBB25_00555 [Sulfitobacter sp.]